jgi:dihydroxy-acid dehydratase
MGAASADVPAIMITGGPSFAGIFEDKRLGSGTDGRKLFDRYRSGAMSEEEFCELEGCVARSNGHCNVMGTASTMACLAETLGMMLPGCAAIPAADSRRLAISQETGRRIVDMVHEDLRPSRILSREAIENAVTTDMAIGGSTNAVVHLIAIAGRLGFELPLEEFDRISRKTPYIVNLKPSGEFLLQDMFHAGGMPAVLRELLPLLSGECLTVTGRSLAENVQNAKCVNRHVIRKLDEPLHPEGGTVVLRGNLAPGGAVLKQTAASPHLLHKRGRAHVFEDHDAMIRDLERDDLPVDEETILVMKNGGPRGGPGFPEWGHIPMPKVLLKRGITDMIRISDARMSGTSFGTVVLHVAPESAVGGPLAVVRTGDEIELNTSERRLDLLVSPDEIRRRLTEFTPPPPHYRRGYGKLFLDHITQADQGCDFDFLLPVRH